MNTKNEQKTKPSVSKPIGVVLVVVLILCAAGIVMTAISQRTAVPNLRETLVYVGYILTLLYAFAGFRAPHGNMLKYTLLVFAAFMVVTVMSNPSIYSGSMAPQGEPEALAEAPADVPQQPDGPADAPDKPEAMTPAQEKRANLFELGFTGAILILISYMAGRLDRIKENSIIVIIVLGLFLLRAFLANYGGRRLPVGLNEFNMWLVLSASYLCRYRQHKEAGLVDG